MWALVNLGPFIFYILFFRWIMSSMAECAPVLVNTVVAFPV